MLMFLLISLVSNPILSCNIYISNPLPIFLFLLIFSIKRILTILVEFYFYSYATDA
jgi:hypothetical protein